MPQTRWRSGFAEIVTKLLKSDFFLVKYVDIC